MTKRKWIVSVPGKNLISDGIYFKIGSGSLSIMTSQSMLGTFGIAKHQYEFNKEELKKFGLANCPKHIVDKTMEVTKYERNN